MQDVKYVCPECGHEAEAAGLCPHCQASPVVSCPVCGNLVVGEHIHPVD